jgi:hypothetical protein
MVSVTAHGSKPLQAPDKNSTNEVEAKTKIVTAAVHPQNMHQRCQKIVTA